LFALRPEKSITEEGKKEEGTEAPAGATTKRMNRRRRAAEAATAATATTNATAIKG